MAHDSNLNIFLLTIIKESNFEGVFSRGCLKVVVLITSDSAFFRLPARVSFNCWASNEALHGWFS